MDVAAQTIHLTNRLIIMKSIIILGASRSDGHTAQLARNIAKKMDATFIDLSDATISFFDYKQQNLDDDFLPIIKHVLAHDHIIFASPVYWYCMSAQLKVFIDRISDLLTTKKELGRQLKGKSCSVISTGSDSTAPACFFEPFKRTAAYLNITYTGDLYQQKQEKVAKEPLQEIDNFIKKITS